MKSRSEFSKICSLIVCVCAAGSIVVGSFQGNWAVVCWALVSLLAEFELLSLD